MKLKNQCRRGVSLIEVMLVIVVIAVFAGIVIPDASTEVVQQLQSAAEIVAADIAYCQSLAISNNSKYSLTFNKIYDQYNLKHSGTDASLDALPEGVFRANASTTIRRTKITNLSSMGSEVQLHAVYALTPAPVSVVTLEFGSLGETTRSEETVVWLKSGSSADRRYLPIYVDPVTGLTEIGNAQVAMP